MYPLQLLHMHITVFMQCENRQTTIRETLANTHGPHNTEYAKSTGYSSTGVNYSAVLSFDTKEDVSLLISVSLSVTCNHVSALSAHEFGTRIKMTQQPGGDTKLPKLSVMSAWCCIMKRLTKPLTQRVVIYMLPVEAFVIGVKNFDQPNLSLIT